MSFSIPPEEHYSDECYRDPDMSAIRNPYRYGLGRNPTRFFQAFTVAQPTNKLKTISILHDFTINIDGWQQLYGDRLM